MLIPPPVHWVANQA